MKREYPCPDPPDAMGKPSKAQEAGELVEGLSGYERSVSVRYVWLRCSLMIWAVAVLGSLLRMGQHHGL